MTASIKLRDAAGHWGGQVHRFEMCRLRKGGGGGLVENAVEVAANVIKQKTIIEDGKTFIIWGFKCPNG